MTQKWQTELYASPLWLLQTLAGVVLVSVLIILILSKTRFGQQFWHILQPCLDPKSSVKIMLMIILMVTLLLTEIRLFVLNTFLYNSAYSALQDKLANVFWTAVLINAALMLTRSINGIINNFLDQALAIKWAEKFNQVLVDFWLNGKNYYRLQKLSHLPDNPDNIDQRIQQDAQDFIISTIEFVRGMLDSILSTIQFTVVLWGLAGVLNIFGLEIPRGIVFIVYIAILLATAVAMWIGRPLVRSNYDNEKLNGDYRYSLIRVREHAESIAFYNGEWLEKKQLAQRFQAIIKNRWKIARQSVTLSGFNDIFSQILQLLPLMLQAPRFFAGQIKIGDMQQTVQSFARLQKAMSFFRNFYRDFTAYRARLNRLDGFISSMEETTVQTNFPSTHEISDGLALNNVTLYQNNGKILLNNISLEAQAGDSLLINGPSGCGKTSLLRVLAELWPFGSSGKIHRPALRHILFIPQHAYMPQGTLREAICYPNIDPQNINLVDVLCNCRLGHLIYRLDETSDWQNLLSPGELQRIAFARILLLCPEIILLDEATSALDEETEASLYRLVRLHLPQSIIISIGHRSTLSAFHNKLLTFSPTSSV